MSGGQGLEKLRAPAFVPDLPFKAAYTLSIGADQQCTPACPGSLRFNCAILLVLQYQVVLRKPQALQLHERVSHHQSRRKISCPFAISAHLLADPKAHNICHKTAKRNSDMVSAQLVV